MIIFNYLKSLSLNKRKTFFYCNLARVKYCLYFCISK
nr:MAG TPA: hypothetical protein [Caudoviricetes sp.]